MSTSSPSSSTSSNQLYVQHLSEHAQTPTRAHEGDVGYDLYAAHDCTIESKGKALIKTDIAVAIPPGHYGRIAPRSSLAWKKHTDIGAGVIDQGYRGPVCVAIFNHGQESVDVRKGDRVAQLILERCSTPAVTVVDELPSTDRGEGGFGSTGV